MPASSSYKINDDDRDAYDKENGVDDQDDTDEDDDDIDGTRSVEISRPTVGVCPPPLWSLHYYHSTNPPTIVHSILSVTLHGG